MSFALLSFVGNNTPKEFVDISVDQMHVFEASLTDRSSCEIDVGPSTLRGSARKSRAANDGHTCPTHAVWASGVGNSRQCLISTDANILHNSQVLEVTG